MTKHWQGGGEEGRRTDCGGLLVGSGHHQRETHGDDQWAQTMGAESARSLALSAGLLPKTAYGEDPQTMGAGAPGSLPALPEHGDGQDAHTVGGRPSRAVAAPSMMA